MGAAFIAFLGMMMVIASQSSAEDGYQLWLRYKPISERTRSIGQIVVKGSDPSLDVAIRELQTALRQLTGRAIERVDSPTTQSAVVLAPGSSTEFRDLGDEGFSIRDTEVAGHRATVIGSNSSRGTLYGVFHFLRLLQTGQAIESLDIRQRPRLQLRLLNHWDNLDGSIERGYAGKSLWRWDELPGKIDPRYTDYARALASIGLNGTVLNNVNAKPQSLSPDYLRKTKALADVFRPYGIRVYLSANFAAPKILGGLPTADPLDQRVADWWRAKAHEIYALIPDFGGFVVKANSEGQPGPQDYGRTHADGANLLADAVAPHGGIIMWRAFVYDDKVDPDRAKRAYLEFTVLDGKFRPNVIVQVKNGPIDFMPREPFHPLFGAMKHTPVMAELQVTQEYLGHSNHLVYLAPMWKEFLDADTFPRGPGSSVAKVIEGKIEPYKITGIAAVANTGSDRNWCGHHFAQANWYAYGRLAWDPDLSAQAIADEWLAMTFGPLDPTAHQQLRSMMLGSWETFISYTMPLGLHHLIGGNHYAPQPWNGKEPRPDWTATYYHQADERGVGFDRTSKGSNAVSQYFSPLREDLASLEKCPETLLLWFHHVPWDHRMRSGRTLWQELCWKYNSGFEQADAMLKKWESLAGSIDAQRHRDVTEKLKIQVADARVWRDQCVLYFQRFSKMPLPTWPLPINPQALESQP
jgi:alpha-glucuronidase